MHIVSPEECRRAVRHMGFSAVGQWIGSHKSIPHYCSIDEAKAPHVVFNWDPKGQPRADVAPLCRTARYPTWETLKKELANQSSATSLPEPDAALWSPLSSQSPRW